MFSDYERRQNLPEEVVMWRAYRRLLSIRRSTLRAGVVAIVPLVAFVLFSVFSPNQSLVRVLCFVGALLLMMAPGYAVWIRPDLIFRYNVSRMVPELTPKGQKMHDRICGALRSPTKDAVLGEFN